MANEIYGRYYSNEEISNLPSLRVENGVHVVALPDGREAYVAPRYSENGNGWWSINYEGEEFKEMYLFETLEAAERELRGD